jgi:hypothetical protein
MEPEQICDLVKLAVNSTFFKFEEQLYAQKTGLAMGSKISPCLSDIYMETLVKKAKETYPKQPIYIKKYVDDFIFIYNSKEIQASDYLNHLNSIDPNIQFTLEEENNKQLPFLDIMLERKNNQIITKVYRKPTDQGLLLNYNSAHSNSTKATVARSGLYRAHKYCTQQSDLKIEITKVYETLLKNDYPLHVIKKIHRKVKEKIKTQNNTTPTNDSSSNENENSSADPSENSIPSDNNKNKVITIVMPYVKQVSENIQRFTREHFDTHIRVAFKCKNTLRKILTHVKPKSKPLLKDCVYKISCQKQCGKVYIGQTKRDLKTRVKEHMAATKTLQDPKAKNYNHLAHHAQKEGHILDFENATAIHFEQNLQRRKTAEAMAMVCYGEKAESSQPNITHNSRHVEPSY